MPRIAKDKKVENEKKNEKKVVEKKKTSSNSKSSSKKTEPAKKTTRKSSLSKIIESVEPAKSEVKKSTSSKAKTATKKESATKAKTSTKKAAEPKTKVAKSTSKTVKKAEPKAKKEEPKKSKSTTTKNKAETTAKKKTETKKTTAKKAAKSTATKKTATKETKAASKKATKTTKVKEKAPTTKKRASKKSSKKDDIVVQIAEYYDLPLKYGNTVVKLLAQTPKTLFVYWEVSDSDINNFKKQYGEDFFNKTKPFLIVHNLTLNKKTEIEINDFANSWYLNTEDSDCKFDIELVRKFIDKSSKVSDEDSNYLYIAKSNTLTSPNNHILFEKIQEFVVFKDTNNDKKVKKNIKSFKFLEELYKFYKDMYDEEILNNPSSQFNFQ